MKRTFMVTCLLIGLFTLPQLAQACYKIVFRQVECDSCGFYVDNVTVCQSFYSSGLASCDPTYYLIPCSQGDCGSLIGAAFGSGNCGMSAPTGPAAAPSAFPIILSPNPEGGYSASTAVQSSCLAPQGSRP